MSLSTKKKLVLVKVETSYGTDPTPVGSTDGLLCRTADCTPLEVGYEPRNLIRPYLGTSPQLPVSYLGKLDIEFELAGYGTAGPDDPLPAYDALLRSCGLSQTFNTGVSYVYAPLSDTFESVTLYFYQDGTLQKMTGARGTFTLDVEQKKIPFYKFSMQGLVQPTPLTDTALATVDFSAFQTPLVASSTNTAGVVIHGYSSAALAKLSFDLGNTLVHRQLIGPSETILITDRNTKGSVSVEMTLVAAQNWLAGVKSAALASVGFTHGPSGNQVAFASSNAQILNPKYSDLDNIVMLDMDLGFIPSSAGNDEFSLTIL